MTTWNPETQLCAATKRNGERCNHYTLDYHYPAVCAQHYRQRHQIVAVAAWNAWVAGACGWAS